MQTSILGRLAALSLALLLWPAMVRAEPEAKVDEVQHARVGETLLLKFPGNRDGGYQWTLNEGQSRGTDLVQVEEVGWVIARDQGSLLFPQLPVLSISVLGKAPGQADLAFDYYRSWGNRPFIKSKVVRVVIAAPAN